MTSRVVHISFSFPGVPKMLDLEPAIASICDDWIRYSTTNWFIFTSRDNVRIAEHLTKFLDPNDLVFVHDVNSDPAAGVWMARLPPWVWNWLTVKMPGKLLWQQPTGLLPAPKT